MKHYSTAPLLTIQDLINAGFPLNKPIILQDPDTYWILAPTFTQDDEHIIVTSDYGERRPDLEK